MTEREALLAFIVILGAMIAVGALLPSVAPGLIDLLDRTVLSGEKRKNRH